MAETSAAVVTHCVFCDLPLTRINRSAEHVFPQWVREIPLVKETFTTPPNAGKRRIMTGRSLSFGNTLIDFPLEMRLSRSKFMHPFYGTVPVCKPCNTGWMSQIEDAAKLEVGPLVNGTTTIVEEALVPFLRTWATKTAIVAELDDPGTRTFIRAQRRDILEGRRARWTEVFVGQFDEPKYPNMVHKAMNVYSRGSAAMTCIAVGRLVTMTVNLSLAPQYLGFRDFVTPPGWTRLIDGKGAVIGPTGFTNQDLRLHLHGAVAEGLLTR